MDRKILLAVLLVWSAILCRSLPFPLNLFFMLSICIALMLVTIATVQYWILKKDFKAECLNAIGFLEDLEGDGNE